MPRTVIDMAAVCSEGTVDIALDAAIRSGMSRAKFLDRLDELSAPGRNGIAVVKKLVGERVAEQGLTESPFERLLMRALKRARLPLPVCQTVVGAARVDFAYPHQGLIIEADGYRWHDGRSAWERDRLRISELAARGWRVLLVTWLQLKYRATDVVDRIRRASTSWFRRNDRLRSPKLHEGHCRDDQQPARYLHHRQFLTQPDPGDERG
jgi:very-short-patch-repair endonuclease